MMKLQVATRPKGLGKKLDEKLEAQFKAKLVRQANLAIAVTMGENAQSKPALDTGAYLRSWSFNKQGRPRRVDSRRLTKGSGSSVDRDAAQAALYSDISQIKLKGTTAIYLQNGAPHAPYVEYKHRYYIMETIANRIRNGNY